MAFNTYRLQGGERMQQTITKLQEPLVRSVRNQVYQLYGDILKVPGERTTGSMQQPEMVAGARRITIDQLVEPIS